MRFRIHPALGIARTGDSPDWFVGPETADTPTPPTGGYKDPHGRIRRQAARFRVFDHSGAKPVEVKSSAITWSVQLGREEGAPAALSVTGAEQHATFAPVPFPGASQGGVSFGELRTESKPYRLLVVGGKLDGGFDGTASGWVKATVNGEEAAAAWVVVAPPNFCPAARPIVSAYDRLYEAFHGAWGLTPPSKPSYARDIWPILRSYQDAGGSFLSQFLPSLLHREMRKQVADQLPLIEAVPGPERVWVTKTQKQFLNAWVDGDFTDDSGDVGTPSAITPANLDRGALEHCLLLGTAWELGSDLLNSASNYAEAFRLDPTKVPLGFGRNRIGWQGDFGGCMGEWPIHTGTHFARTMPPAPQWHTRGFVIRDEGAFNYIEETGTSASPPPPYLFSYTPVLDLGKVTLGKKVDATIAFELGSQTNSYNFDLITPLPPSITATTAHAHVAAMAPGEVKTATLVVTFHATTLGDYFNLVRVKLSHRGEYDVRVRARVVDAT